MRQETSISTNARLRAGQGVRRQEKSRAGQPVGRYHPVVVKPHRVSPDAAGCRQRGWIHVLHCSFELSLHRRCGPVRSEPHSCSATNRRALLPSRLVGGGLAGYQIASNWGFSWLDKKLEPPSSCQLKGRIQGQSRGKGDRSTRCVNFGVVQSFFWLVGRAFIPCFGLVDWICPSRLASPAASTSERDSGSGHGDRFVRC